MSTSSRTPPPSERVAMRKLWWVGLLAIVVSTVANGLIRALALALLDVHPDFMPLQSPTFIGLTVILVGAAVGVYWLLGRFSRRPITTFRIVAVIVLILSFLPDIGLVLSGAPGAAWDAALVLMFMHIVAAAITVGTLTTLARE